MTKRLMVIRQMSQCRWQVENSKGDIMTQDLPLESVYRATEYIKGYISSYLNYNYEVIPLRSNKNESTN